jgi:HSP20 family protein
MLRNKVTQKGDEETSNNLVNKTTIESDITTQEEGMLAIEGYETDKDVIFLAPVAGAEKENITIAISKGVMTIRGHRENMKRKQSLKKYLCQECYWGTFSRSVKLPKAIKGQKPHASFKKGILKVRFHKNSIN